MRVIGLLIRLVCEGLSEKVTVQQGSVGSEEGNQKDVWPFQMRERKGLEVKTIWLSKARK